MIAEHADLLRPDPSTVRPNVIVTHPGLQHAHQLALALHEHRLLAELWSGIPVASRGEPLPWWLPPGYAARVRRVEIPAGLRTHPVQFQMLLRAATRLGRMRTRGDRIHRVFHQFDAWAAHRLAGRPVDAVVAYENAAYHTFAAAKAMGARCVLDAAALHHVTAKQLLGSRDTPYTAEINRRKDEEIRMADLILTCSPMAMESYASNGVPAHKLRSLVLGAEAPLGAERLQPHGGPARFVFAGSLSRLKSIDTILAAFRRLHAEGHVYELAFVGGVADPQMLREVEMTPHAVHTPSVAQQDLFAILAHADCLLLPSRYDSFGMVVAEAMACATPAIVSTRTGAKAIVESFPASGWVVEPDVESLYLLLRRLLSDHSLLQQARAPALQASREYSWTRYRERAGQALEEFLL